jgi:hypothetical protein
VVKSDDGGKVRDGSPGKVIISGPRPVVAKRRLHSMCFHFGIDFFFNKKTFMHIMYLPKSPIHTDLISMVIFSSGPREAALQPS